MHVGHYIMTSQYPVKSDIYGGIYLPLKHYFKLTLYIKFYDATAHVVLANQKRENDFFLKIIFIYCNVQHF